MEEIFDNYRKDVAKREKLEQDLKLAKLHKEKDEETLNETIQEFGKDTVNDYEEKVIEEYKKRIEEDAIDIEKIEKDIENVNDSINYLVANDKNIQTINASIKEIDKKIQEKNIELSKKEIELQEFYLKEDKEGKTVQDFYNEQDNLKKEIKDLEDERSEATEILTIMESIRDKLISNGRYNEINEKIKENEVIEEESEIEEMWDEFFANQIIDVTRPQEPKVEEKPVEEKSAEEKPVEEKPAEEKPAEEKPAEEKPAEEKPVEEKPVEEKPVEEKPVEEKPAEEKPVEEKPVEEKPVEEQKDDKSKYASAKIKIRYIARRNVYEILLIPEEGKVVAKEKHKEGFSTNRTVILERENKSEQEFMNISSDIYVLLSSIDKSMLTDRTKAFVEKLTDLGKTKEQRQRDMEELGIEISYDLKGIYSKNFPKENREEILKDANIAKKKGVGEVKKGAYVAFREKLEKIGKRINPKNWISSKKVEMIEEAQSSFEEDRAKLYNDIEQNVNPKDAVKTAEHKAIQKEQLINKEENAK